MARLLLKATDTIHPDPALDAQVAFKAGDVVVVMPDSHEWSPSEDAPTFIRVDLPGVDPAALVYLTRETTADPATVMSAAALAVPGLRQKMLKERNRPTVSLRGFSVDPETKSITRKTFGA